MRRRGDPSWKTILLVLVLAGAGCVSPADEADLQEPEAAGLDEARLRDALDSASRVGEMKSLLVWRDGRIVAEGYFNGTTKDETHDVRSVTKSFLSALIGIAIEEGQIDGTGDLLEKYLSPIGEPLTPAWSEVRLRDLLTMTAGHTWLEIGPRSEFMNWTRSADQIRYVLDKPVESEPGTRFCYSDGSAHLTGVVLAEATGTSALDYARRVLFEPLGIPSRRWKTDKRSYNLGGVGLQVTPRDMIKFGVLYLRRGKYDGVQVVPERWVEESTSRQIATRNAIPLGPEYGYYWWIGRAGAHDLYFASGYGGQFIVVVPDLELVVVATRDWQRMHPKAKTRWTEILEIIVSKVVPAAESG